MSSYKLLGTEREANGSVVSIQAKLKTSLHHFIKSIQHRKLSPFQKLRLYNRLWVPGATFLALQGYQDEEMLNGIDEEATKYFKTILKLPHNLSKFKLFDENTLALKSLREVCVSQQMAMIYHQGLKSKLELVRSIVGHAIDSPSLMTDMFTLLKPDWLT